MSFLNRILDFLTQAERRQKKAYLMHCLSLLEIGDKITIEHEAGQNKLAKGVIVQNNNTADLLLFLQINWHTVLDNNISVGYSETLLVKYTDKRLKKFFDLNPKLYVNLASEELEELKKQIQYYTELEEYEKCAEIRDKITTYYALKQKQ